MPSGSVWKFDVQSYVEGNTIKHTSTASVGHDIRTMHSQLSYLIPTNVTDPVLTGWTYKNNEYVGNGSDLATKLKEAQEGYQKITSFLPIFEYKQDTGIFGCDISDDYRTSTFDIFNKTPNEPDSDVYTPNPNGWDEYHTNASNSVQTIGFKRANALAITDSRTTVNASNFIFRTKFIAGVNDIGQGEYISVRTVDTNITNYDNGYDSYYTKSLSWTTNGVYLRSSRISTVYPTLSSAYMTKTSDYTYLLSPGVMNKTGTQVNMINDYVYMRTEKYSTPKNVRKVGKKLTWSAVTNAQRYVIYKNGSLFTTTSDTSYTINSASSSGDVYQVGVNNAGSPVKENVSTAYSLNGAVANSAYARDVYYTAYYASDLSSKITFTGVGTTVLSVDSKSGYNYVFKWTAASNVSYYKLTIDGTSYTVNGTTYSYTFPDGSDGIHTISITPYTSEGYTNTASTINVKVLGLEQSIDPYLASSEYDSTKNLWKHTIQWAALKGSNITYYITDGSNVTTTTSTSYVTYKKPNDAYQFSIYAKGLLNSVEYTTDLTTEVYSQENITLNNIIQSTDNLNPGEVKLSWDSYNYINHVEVTYTDYTKDVKTVTTTTNDITISGIPTGNNTISLTPVYENGSTLRGNTSDITVTIDNLEIPNITVTNDPFNQVNVSWNKYPSNYEIYLSENNGTYESYDASTITSTIFDRKINDTYTYQFYLRYKGNNSTSIVGEKFITLPLLERIDVEDITANQDSYNSVIVSWKASDKANRYKYTTTGDKWYYTNSPYIRLTDVKPSNTFNIVIKPVYWYSDNYEYDGDRTQSLIMTSALPGLSMNLESPEYNKITLDMYIRDSITGNNITSGVTYHYLFNEDPYVLNTESYSNNRDYFLKTSDGFQYTAISEFEDGVDYYIINKNFISTKESTIEIGNLQPQKYTIYAYASVSFGDDVENTSIINNSITLEKLTVAEGSIGVQKVNLYTYRIIVNVPDNATPVVRIDNGQVLQLSNYGDGQKAYTLQFPTVGSHTVSYYYTLPSGTSDFESNTVTETFIVEKLPAPEIRLVSTGDGFEWDYDTYGITISYLPEVSVDGGKSWMPFKETTVSSFSLSDLLPFNQYLQYLEAGSYKWRLGKAFIPTRGNDYLSYYDSDPSNEVDITITQLSSPEVSWKTNTYKTSILSIGTVENAASYSIYINDELLETIYDSGEYTSLMNYVGNKSGRYEIKVIANAGSLLFISSESEKLYYEVSQLDMPELKFNTSTNTVYWDAIGSEFYSDDDFTTYDIYIDDESTPFSTVTTNKWSVSDALVNFSVSAQAYHVEQDPEYPNPYIIPSEVSTKITIGQWPTPTNLRVESEDGTVVIDTDGHVTGEYHGNTAYLVWDINSNATPSVENVYTYGNLFNEVSENRMIIPSSYAEVYNFSVKIPEYGYTKESGMSPVLRVEVSQLSSPEIYLVRNAYQSTYIDDEGYEIPVERYNFTLHFTPVPGAEYYKLLVNGIEYKHFIYNDGEEISLPDGSSEVTLQACSDNPLLINSNPSNIVTKYIKPDYNYYCVINNEFSREIELPFTIGDTGDESLATGSLTLTLNDDKDPYETNTDISIRMTGENVDPLDDSTKYVGKFPFNMLIAADQVDEVFVNGKSKYRHNISVIEQTKLLEYEIMPDIAFTQPQAVTAIHDYKTITPDNGGNIILKEVGSSISSIDSILPETNFNKLYKSYTTTNFTNIINAVKDKYNDSDNIMLPYIPGAAYKTHTSSSVSSTTSLGIITLLLRAIGINIIVAGINAAVITRALREIIKINGPTRYKYATINYYIREHSNSYEKELTNPEYKIMSYKYDGLNIPGQSFAGNTAPYFTFSKLSSSIRNSLSGNNFDIIMEIEDSDIPVYTQDMFIDFKEPLDIYTSIFTDAEFNKDDFISIGVNSTGYNVTGMYSSTPNMANVSMDNFKYEEHSNADIPSKSKKFRLVYKDVTISNTTSSDELPENAITMTSAIERVILLNEPLTYDSSLRAPLGQKYQLDPVIKNNIEYQRMLCPQVSYTNGRSMFEILLDLGRQIKGIPYLKYTADSAKTISFRIMDNTDDGVDDSGDILLSSESSMENNVTGFVSNVNNIISEDENAIYYPSKDGWITPRASTGGVLSTDNASIVLDKPIYKLLQVIVSGFSKTSKNMEVDITNYVVEKTIYDSLNNNRDGKGLALVYKKGSNTIDGLGILPENSLLQSLLGLSPDEYVINRIINDILGQATISGNASDNIKDFKFRIKYVPYSDTQLKLTQFNISNENILSYKAYNQTENLVSDEKFGKSLSTQIERLGNNDIKRTYITRSVYPVYEDGTLVDNTGLPGIFKCRKFDNTRYYLDNVKYTFNEQYISVEENYTKNYNRINDRIGVSSEYRQYEITLNPTANRVMNFNQYCYIDTKEYKMDPKYGISNSSISNALTLTIEDMLLGNPEDTPTKFFIGFKTSTLSDISYTTFKGKTERLSYGVMLPVTKLNIKNALVFNAKMLDNFSAGTYADRDAIAEYENNASEIKSGLDNLGEAGKWIYDHLFSVAYYGSKDVRYVDDYGRADIIDISLCNPNNTSLVRLDSEYQYSLPKIGTSTNILNTSKLEEYNSIFSGRYYVNKDSSEALSFNYQINFNSLNANIDSHSGLTRYLFKDDVTVPYAPELVLYKGNIKNTDYLDENMIVSEKYPLDIKRTDNDTVYIDSIEGIPCFEGCDGYAIIWSFTRNSSTNEILFYVEKPNDENLYTTDKLYFNLLDKPIVNNDLRRSDLNS